MKKFRIEVEGEEYLISPNSAEYPIFSVEHRSGVHVIVYKESSNEWVADRHIPFTEPIDIEKVGKAILEEINNEG